jgi:hypothetical protein
MNDPAFESEVEVILETVFEFIYFSDPGRQAQSRASFDDFLSTFNLAG